MVLSGTKRSFRTGNTLRNIRDRQTNKRADSVIVRHVNNQQSQAPVEEADDALLPADSILFSLNKKGRWNLPEVIETNISQASETGVRVALLRRHRVNRQNDCLSVTVSGSCEDHQYDDEASVLQRKKARRKTYCNGLNVLHSGRGKSHKDTRKKKVVSSKKDLDQRKQADTEDSVQSSDVIPTAEVRYDVFYPVPASSSLRYHPKFRPSSQADCIEQRLTATAGVKSKKASYHRHKYVDVEGMYDEEDYYYDWDNDEEDFYDYDHGDNDLNSQCLYTQVQSESCESLFSDLMDQALEARFCSSVSPTRPKSRRPASRKRKGHFFYSPETGDEFDSCLEDGQSETSSAESESSLPVVSEPTSIKVTHIPSVNVRLAREATRPSRLAQQYGPKYTEAACLPRKIIIDTTDRVQKAATTAPAFQGVYVPSLDLTTYAILTYIGPDSQGQERQDSECCQEKEGADSEVTYAGQTETNTSQYDVFRLQLNMNCNTQLTAFHLPGRVKKSNNMDDVIDTVIEFITTLSPQHITRHLCQASPGALKSRLLTHFHTVAQVNDWQVACVSLLNKHNHSPANSGSTHLDHDEGAEVTVGSAPKTVAELLGGDDGAMEASENSRYCHVCFDDLGGASGAPATALAQCRHWFCDTCWQSHLAVTAQTTAGGKVLCPEFRCNVEVDLGTQLSLQPLHDVILQQRRQAEERVTRMFVCKWCPNPLCGRVVQLTASRNNTAVSEPSSVTCPCGQHFCARCHGDAHWPMSCDNLVQYQSSLRQHGDLHSEPPAKPKFYNTIIVHGKNCPSCRRFIVREGGCPYMTCVCRYTFWWCCSKHTSKPHDCPKMFTVNDRTGTYMYYIKHIERKKRQRPQPEKGDWYELAVKHRYAQHSREARDDFRKADRLCIKLQGMFARREHVGKHQLLAGKDQEPRDQKERSVLLQSARDIDEAGHTADTSGSQTRVASCVDWRRHVRQSVSGVAQLKMELQHVMEHTAGLLHVRQELSVCQPLTPTTVRKLQDSLDLLQDVVFSLDGLLAAQTHHELVHVLPWFRSLQHNAKDILTNLAALLN